MNMEEKRLTYKDIPLSYPLCFNGECERKARCMHFQAGLLKPEDCHYGPAVYPAAWKSGQCQSFREAKQVPMAYGFTHIYKNVPHLQRAAARRCVMSYFSGGCGPYYRYHHGEKLLSPRQQADIMAILAKFGSTEGLAFDNYLPDWDFD